jgi:hypothetical protein
MMTALTGSEGKPKNFALCECALPNREAEIEGSTSIPIQKNFIKAASFLACFNALTSPQISPMLSRWDVHILLGQVCD